MRSKVLLRTLICLIVVATVVAVCLPVAAEEASWLVTSERGSVGISSPADGDTISGSVEIAGTATSADLWYYKVEYSVDNEQWVTVDSDYEHTTAVTEGILATWDTTAVANATYWLRAVIVDNTGNWVASGSVMVTVDNPEVEEVEEEVAVEAEEEVIGEAEGEVAPAVPEEAAPSWLVTSERGSVGISSPADGDTISGSVEIAGTATSADLWYYKVEYSVDNEQWVTVDSDYEHTTAVTEGTLATWDTTAVANATYWLRAVIVDNTGNWVASGSVMVTVDNPEVEEE